MQYSQRPLSNRPRTSCSCCWQCWIWYTVVFTSPFIAVSGDLVELNELFNLYWRRIIPLGQTSSIAFPFSRLDREPFWQLVPQPGTTITPVVNQPPQDEVKVVLNALSRQRYSSRSVRICNNKRPRVCIPWPLVVCDSRSMIVFQIQLVLDWRLSGVTAAVQCHQYALGGQGSNHRDIPVRTELQQGIPDGKKCCDTIHEGWLTDRF